MSCYTRMKIIFLQGVIWLCLLNLGFVLAAIEPGYLDFDNLPDTNFSCVGKVIGGYYADLETNCQMFHVCTIGQLDEPMDIRFLCLNGTVFDQETRVCERVDEVDCTKSEKFYHLNLELYGNTAPPILEESEETELPIISSTTTTSRPTTTTRATRATFYTTPVPTLPTTTHNIPKVITSNQFPINSGPDIRFNPAEINIKLTPGSPPIIKSPSIKGPSVSYQQQAFNGGDARITVTTHTAVYKDDKIGTSQKSIPNLNASTQKPKSVVSYGLTHSNNQQMYHHKPQFDYHFQQTENTDIDYHTDLPSNEYIYHDDHMYDQMNYQSSNKKPQTQFFVSSTTKRTNHNEPSFISSTAFPPALKPRQFNYQRTDKPSNLQLPLPLFPTLSPLTFSSPAPFTLTRHFEQKRSNDHHERPRIIVSASASVSDATGRRLNYSLGTIGTSHLIPKAPHTYDEYKEDDVGLDPFYHDVPKVKSRQRRDLSQVIRDKTVDNNEDKSKKQSRNRTEKIDEENSANEDLSSQEIESTTHWTPPEYVDDNYEPLTYNISEDISKQNKTNAETLKVNETKLPEVEYEYYYEYVDDNYEPSMYNETMNTTEYLLTTEVVTNPSLQTTTQDISLEVTVTEPYQNLMVSNATTQISEVETIATTTEEVLTNSAIMERRSDVVEESTTVLPTTNDYITQSTFLINISFIPTTESNMDASTYYVTTEQNIQNSTMTSQNTTNIEFTIDVDSTTEAMSTTNIETTIDIDRTIVSTTEENRSTIENFVGVSSSDITESTRAHSEIPITESLTPSTEITSTPTENIDALVESTTTEGTGALIESTVATTESTEFPTGSTEAYTESTIAPTEINIHSFNLANISTDNSIIFNEATTSAASKSTAVLDTMQVTTENAGNETEILLDTTTSTSITTTTTTHRYSYLKPREPNFKRNPKTKPTPRHRFSYPSIHLSPSVLKLGSKMANPILDSMTEETISEELNHRIRTNNILSDSQHILTTASYDEDITDAPLSKSANPTEPKSTKGSSMHTTPITKTLFIPRRFTYDVTRSFNCFGKEMNQFYEDPRDCRLFHYCTPGYTKTQVLDMKYVCDYGTYFDSDKLICAKVKPQRCKLSGKQA